MNSGKSHQLVTNMGAEVLLSLDEENSSWPELVPCSSITRRGLSWAPSFLSETSSDVERMLFASLERTLRGTAECFHQEMKAKKGIFFFLTSVRCAWKRYSELSTIHIGRGIRTRKTHQPTWVLYRASEKGEREWWVFWCPSSSHGGKGRNIHAWLPRAFCCPNRGIQPASGLGQGHINTLRCSLCSL